MSCTLAFGDTREKLGAHQRRGLSGATSRVSGVGASTSSLELFLLRMVVSMLQRTARWKKIQSASRLSTIAAPMVAVMMMTVSWLSLWIWALIGEMGTGLVVGRMAKTCSGIGSVGDIVDGAMDPLDGDIARVWNGQLTAIRGWKFRK